MEYTEIILGLVSAVFSLVASTKWKGLSLLAKIALVIGIIATSYGAYVSFLKTQKENKLERIQAKVGNIIDATDAVIPVFQFGRDSSAAKTMNLTQDGVLFGYADGTPALKLYIKNGKIFLNTIVYDLQGGEPIAAIEDGEWTVFDDGYEYNDDGKALELVTKGERKVIFQLEVKGNIAYYQGFLLGKTGFGLIIHRGDTTEGGGVLRAVTTEYDKVTVMNEVNIPRIFKYPRAKHYGERLEGN